VIGPARLEPAPAAARATGPLRPVPVISLSVKDADLVEVVRSLARIAGLNLIVDPGVAGTVTAELVNVRWDHALAVILRTQGFAMEIDGRIVTVAPPARLYPRP
jgi:type II secretory pathway component HofQ